MLKKLFIKDYKNIQDSNVRNTYGKVAGIFGIIINLILGSVKIILGFITNSVSLMVDASNNLFDTVTSILTIFGFKLSSKAPTKKHPYGFARYEYICGFVIALFMLCMGIIFTKESIIKIIKPEELIITNVTYIILISTLIIKIFQMYVYNNFAKTINSKTLKASAVEARNDLLANISILISMLVKTFFNINIDGVVGLIVSGLIIISSLETINEVIEPIIGIQPTEEKIKKITNKLLSYQIVEGVHNLVIHNYGVNNDFATVHLEIDSNLEKQEICKEINKIEEEIKRELGITLTVHVDLID